MHSDSLYRHVIDTHTGIARVWMTGRIDADAKHAALDALYSDPLWKGEMTVIWDCAYATEVIVLPHDVPPLLDAITQDLEGCDLFYGDHDIAYLMAKLFATLERRRGKRARVCRSMSEVLSELKRDDLPFPLRDPRDGVRRERKSA